MSVNICIGKDSRPTSLYWYACCCCSVADDESESSDTGGNYEDIEAKLQQERIEYLQSVRKRSEPCQ